MVISHDVDVCVTCVSEKPPTLPLREELVSLGVEVIYKAAGVGINAARSDARKKVKEFREQLQKNQQRSSSLVDSPKTPEEEVRQRIAHRRLEREIFQRRNSVTYEAYARRLDRQDSSDSDSLSSLDAPFGFGINPRSESRFDDCIGVQPEVLGGVVSPMNEQQDTREPEHILQESIRGTDNDTSSFPCLTPEKITSRPQSPPLAWPCNMTIDANYDEDSDGSTFAKDNRKVLVSSSGNRWWHQQIEFEKKDIQKDATMDNVSVRLSNLDRTTAHEASQDKVSTIPNLFHTQEGPEKKCHFSDSSGMSHLFSRGPDEVRDGKSDNVNATAFPNSVVESETFKQKRTSTPQRIPIRSAPWFLCNLEDVCVGWRQAKIANHDVEIKNFTINSGATEITSNKSDQINFDGLSPLSLKGNALGASCHSFNECDIDNCTLKKGTNLLSMSSHSFELTDARSLETYPNDSDHLQRKHASDGVRSFETHCQCSDISDDQRLSYRLFTLLSKPDCSIAEIHELIRKSPSLARVICQFDGRRALHIACDRNLPDHLGDRSVILVKRTLDILFSDIVGWGSVVNAVLAFGEDTCKAPDKNGDLPVHIAARRLIEWEGQWQARLAGISSLDADDKNKISKLYQEMSRIIEAILDPIISSRSLCKMRGSMGKMLPLHIACIFGVPYSKTMKLIRTYSDAAGIPCFLGNLLTLIEDNLFPLQLLERKRTSDISWPSFPTSSVDCEEFAVSDLLFAFYPRIEPYRSDPERLSRMEELIKNGARNLSKEHETYGYGVMDAAVQSIWIWLCTQGREFGTTHYENNVANIVNSLTWHEVEQLAYLKIGSESVLSAAASECQSILKSRLLQIDGEEIPMPNESKSTHFASSSKQSRALVPPAIRIDPESTPQRTYILASMMKRVFNIQENAHPSTFIILPYKLIIGANGTLTLEDPSSALMALKFAKYLLEVTNPKYLLHQLEKKAIQHAAFKVPTHEMELWTLTEEKHRTIQREFISIYADGPGYLYLLDEIESTPVIQGENGEKFYPIRIEDPVETVRRMMPLMLMGMLHMRGAKSLSILANAIMEGGAQVPYEWIVTVESTLELVSAFLPDKSDYILEALSCKDDLERFVKEATNGMIQRRGRTTEDGYEWVVELTLLKIILERSDIRKSFAGLNAILTQNGEVIWTKVDARNIHVKGTHLKSSKYTIQESRCNQESLQDTETSCVDDLYTLLQETTPSATPFASHHDDPLFRGSRSNAPYSRSFRMQCVHTLLPQESQNFSEERTAMYDRGVSTILEMEEFFQAPENDYWDSRLPTISESSPYETENSSLQSEDSIEDGKRSSRLRFELEKQDQQLELIMGKLSELDLLNENRDSMRGKAAEELAGRLNLYDDLADVELDGKDEKSELETQNREEPTKVLLSRLCALEEKLLLREIELEQIKVDLGNFEVEAVCRSLHHSSAQN